MHCDGWVNFEVNGNGLCDVCKTTFTIEQYIHRDLSMISRIDMNRCRFYPDEKDSPYKE